MRPLLLALVMTIGMSAAALAADVTGKWVGSVDTPNGALELTFELKTEGEAVSGTVGSSMGTLPISNGKLAGDVLEIVRFTLNSDTVSGSTKLVAD